MSLDSTARVAPIALVPEAPKSTPKPRAKRIPRAKVSEAPAFPDPAGHKAKEAISALWPRVTNAQIVELQDPAVLETLRLHTALGEEIKELERRREVASNVLRLAIRGNEGIEVEEYVALWSERRGNLDTMAVLATVRAEVKGAGAVIDRCLAEAETHAGITREHYRQAGGRTLTVRRGEL